MTLRAAVAGSVLFGLLGIACGTEGAQGNGDSLGGSAGAPAGAGGTGATSGAKCAPPEPPAAGQMLSVDSVRAALIDEAGLPAAGVLCTVCGVDLCGAPATSDTQGQVTIFGPGAPQQDPRFSSGEDGRGYAKLAALIPETPKFDFGTVRLLRLPPLSQGASLVPGTDSTSGGVTLTPPAGASIEFDQILFDDTERRFVAALLDLRKLDPAELPAIDPSIGLEVLIGTGAIDTKICPPAALRFDNLVGWPAGTEVEIYINGTQIYDNYAPYGEWAKVADAFVDGGGTMVRTKSDAGIAVLGTFGAKPK